MYHSVSCAEKMSSEKVILRRHITFVMIKEKEEKRENESSLKKGIGLGNHFPGIKAQKKKPKERKGKKIKE